MEDLKKLDTSQLISSLMSYIVIAVLSLIILTIVSISLAREQNQLHMQAEFNKQIDNGINFIIEDFILHYAYQARRMAKTTNIAQIIKSKDREALKKLLEPKFLLMKDETKYFKIMHIHLADGTSFLRVHKPDDYGDNIAKKRLMLQEIHKNHKTVSGYETGIHATAFRVISPIFDKDGIYLGALELGVDLSFILEPMDEISSYKGAIFIREKELELNSIKSDLVINGYKLQTELDKELKEIFNADDIENRLVDYYKFEVNGILYLTHVIVIENFKNDASVKLVFFQNISKEDPFFNSTQLFIYLGIFFILIIIMKLISTRLKAYQSQVTAIYKKQIVKLQEDDEEIQKSQQYHKALFDTMPNILIATNDNEIVGANSVMLKFFEYENLEDFSKVHRCICELFVEEEGYLSSVVDNLNWLDYLKVSPHEVNRVCMLKNAKKHYFLVYVQELNYDKNSRNLVSFVDITEIEKLNERLEIAVNGTNDGLWDWDVGTQNVFYAPRWKEMLGYEEHELANELDTWQSRVHPSDLSVVLDQITFAHTNCKTTYECVHRLKHKDGHWVWVLNRSQIVYDKNSKAIRMVGFHTDMTKEKELELLLHNTINSVQNLIFVKDKEFKYLECNKAFINFLGISKDKIIGCDDYELFDKKIADEFRKHDKKMFFDEKERSNYEWVTYPDGKEAYLLTTKFPLYNEDNQIIGLVGNSVDMTENKNLEDDLRASREQFEQFMQYIPANIIIKDENLKILYANDRANKFFKHTSVKRKHSDELFTAGSAKIVAAFNEKVVKNGYNEDVLEFINKSDEPVIHRSLGFKMFANNKVRYGIVSMDITKDYQTQYEVSRLKSALDRSPVSIMMTDRNGVIEYINPNYEKISGYSFEELLGKNPNIVKSGYTKLEKYKEMWEAISSGHIWKSDVKNIAKDGSIFWEDSTIIPSFDSEGIVDGYIAFKQDITDQIAVRKKMHDQEEMMIVQSRYAAMGEMISMIAHQWRQPISVIAMDANNILVDVELDSIEKESLKTDVTDIIEQTQYLSKTIDDFRNFFKPNKLKDVISVEDVFFEALRVVDKSLLNNNIDIENIFNSSTKVEIFSRELLQVFINLLKNSKEAIEEHRDKDRKIINKISETQDDIIIEVSDNGGGVPDEIIKQIFDPYFSTKNEKNGTGLGLYMSKIIIEKHLFGTLSIENIDQGASFKIVLPKTGEHYE